MRSEERHPAVRSTARDIARRAGVTPDVVTKTFAAILEEISLGNLVVVEGFGKFRVGHTADRRIRTPIVEGGVAVQRSRRCIRFNQAKGASRRLNKE
jgi:nucleoid DNA-binding protein